MSNCPDCTYRDPEFVEEVCTGHLLVRRAARISELESKLAEVIKERDTALARNLILACDAHPQQIIDAEAAVRKLVEVEAQAAAMRRVLENFSAFTDVNYALGFDAGRSLLAELDALRKFVEGEAYLCGFYSAPGKICAREGYWYDMKSGNTWWGCDLHKPRGAMLSDAGKVLAEVERVRREGK